MRNRISCVFLVGILTISCFNFASAETNQDTQYEEFNNCSSYDVENMLCHFVHGPLLGGLSLPVNNVNSSNMSVSIQEEVRGIAEDYTATWCENCVEVEEALDQIANEMSMIQLHFHKCCLGEGEYEDPFGSVSGDEWWDRRNGKRLQPMVVINGGEPVIGSITGTYDNFKSLAEKEVIAETPNINFSWEKYDNLTGKVSWNLDTNEWGNSAISLMTSEGIPEDYKSSLFISLFVVEESVYFPEGTNGLTNYHYIVKDVIGLGNDSGEKEITLPEPYDGDDLSLVLVIEMNYWAISEDKEVTIAPVDESSMLPNVSVSMTILCMMGGAYSRRYIKKFD